jgi:hypothetical protein
MSHVHQTAVSSADQHYCDTDEIIGSNRVSKCQYLNVSPIIIFNISIHITPHHHIYSNAIRWGDFILSFPSRWMCYSSVFLLQCWSRYLDVTGGGRCFLGFLFHRY